MSKKEFFRQNFASAKIFTKCQVYLKNTYKIRQHNPFECNLVSQSAYRKHHSTETALIKVYDDLVKVTDNGQMSALCLRDLTAAFDTVILNCY